MTTPDAVAPASPDNEDEDALWRPLSPLEREQTLEEIIEEAITGDSPYHAARVDAIVEAEQRMARLQI